MFLSLVCAIQLFAQDKSKKPAAPAATVPKITVSIGSVRGGEISAESLSRIIDSAVTAKDANGNTYPIVRFRVLYKFKSTYQDQDTGEKKNSDDMRTTDFSNTSVMSQLWRQSIKDNIKPGDEMIIDNIIVKLKNGNKLMTPSMTFKVR
ncbi:MAG: hypothetical protein BGP14_02350 [Sphingobacteriales bacterium 44-15]|nr:MAG: hypothetical protein BGP14_02350 [Sphingobacteriales bacterium 44-15]